MDYLTFSNRLQYLKEIIESGNAKSPQIISKKFNCSEKTIRRMINILRETGVEIHYCKKNEKYFIEKSQTDN